MPKRSRFPFSLFTPLSHSSSFPFLPFAPLSPFTLILLLTSLASLKIPLLNVLGYEFAALMGILGFFMSFTLGAGQLGRMDTVPPEKIASGLIALFFRLYGRLLLLFTLPVLIQIGHNILGNQCDVFNQRGLGMYLYIVPVILAHGLSLGLLCRHIAKSRKITGLLAVLYFLATVFMSLLEMYVGPRMVCHNVLIGVASVGAYTGYDTKMNLDSSFLWHRAWVGLDTAFFLGILIWLRARSLRRRGLDVPKSALAGPLWVCGIYTLLYLFCLVACPDEMGFGFGRKRLARIASETRETQHFVIHHAPNVPNSQQMDRLSENCEWAYHQIAEALQLSGQQKVHPYFYPSPREEWLATGASGFLFAVPWNLEFHTYVTSSGSSGAALRHELVHVVAEEFGCPVIKASLQMGLVEGTATAVDEGMIASVEAHEPVAAAKKAGVFVGADSFMSTQKFASMSMRKSYVFAGSFCGFLIRTYGLESFKKLYATSNYRKIYGKDLKTLSEEWSLFLDTVPVSPQAVKEAGNRFSPVSFPAFYKEPCPRLGSAGKKKESPYEEADRYVREGKYDHALSLYEEFLKREEGNPKWILKMAEVSDRQGLTDQALERLTQVIEGDKIQPDIRDKGFETAASLLKRLGRWDEAIAMVQRRVEFGYVRDPERLALEIKILSQPFLRDLLIKASQVSEEEARDLYNQARTLAPDCSLPYFYLGKATLWGDRHYDPYLADLCLKFVSLEPDLPGLKAQTLLQVGQAAYWAGLRDQAAACFTQAQSLPAPPQQLRDAQDWNSRLSWTGKAGGSSL